MQQSYLKSDPGERLGRCSCIMEDKQERDNLKKTDVQLGITHNGKYNSRSLSFSAFPSFFSVAFMQNYVNNLHLLCFIGMQH